MTIHKLGYLGASKSVISTTSTGAGTIIHTPPLAMIAAQVVVNGTGTGSFLVEGSIDGTNYSTLIAASTYANARVVKSSTIAPVSHVRARIVSHGSTKDVTVWLSGR